MIPQAQVRFGEHSEYQGVYQILINIEQPTWVFTTFDVESFIAASLINWQSLKGRKSDGMRATKTSC